jgi:DNA-binding beta-propeller fold protein YncE
VKVLNYGASPQIRATIAGLGRTEDVRFSPDERCLAIVENRTNTIHFFEVNIKGAGVEQSINLSAHAAISSDALDYPHGLDFLGNNHFVVANRAGELAFFKFPRDLFTKNKVKFQPVSIAREKKVFGIASGKITSPGSVCSYRISKNCYRILVCNNYQNNVVSFIADLSDSLKLKNEGLLVKRHLDLPDGVDVSLNGRYAALSCHESHNVLIYKLSPFLNRYTAPRAILRDIGCPHGVRFSADGKRIFVADAGTQFLHVFYSEGGDWNETLYAEKTIKIVDDEIYTSSRTDSTGKIFPEEGGLKGLDFANNDELVVTTAEDQVLRFFSTESLVSEKGSVEHISLLEDQVQELRLFQENKKKIRRRQKKNMIKANLKRLLRAPFKKMYLVK